MNKKYIVIDTSTLIYIFNESIKNESALDSVNNLLIKRNINFLIFIEVIGEFLSTDDKVTRELRIDFISKLHQIVYISKNHTFGSVNYLFSIEIELFNKGQTKLDELKQEIIKRNQFYSNATESEEIRLNLLKSSMDSYKLSGTSLMHLETFIDQPNIRSIYFKTIENYDIQEFISVITTVPINYQTILTDLHCAQGSI